MTVMELIAVIGLCISCFSLGYQLGSRDKKDTKK